MKNLWPISQEWLAEKKCMFYKQISHSYWYKSWVYNREKQLQYLSQSAQLEEAGNPWLVRLTMISVSLFVLLFVLWSAIAQVNEVTRAPGEVIPDGFQQSVQHLEGGIIEEILVQEGDIVEQGEPLLQLNTDSLIADIQRTQSQIDLLQGQATRLNAFITGQVADDESSELYKTMLAARESDKTVISRQIAQKEQELSMTSTKLKTSIERLKLLEDSFGKRKQLHDKGFFPEVRLMELKEELIAVRGQKTELQQQQAQAKAALEEFKEKHLSLATNQRDQAMQQLEQAQTELQQNRKLLAKQNERLARLTIRASTRGIVKGLMVNTVGGVVQPGQVLMEIVPLDRPLAVEVRIAPKDVGHLFVGDDVNIKVSSYDFSRYGTIPGVLTSLSATTFVGNDGARYYKGRVQLNKNHMGDVAGRYLILPGMTIMADIITGKRSVLAYLFKPIQTSLESAFQER